uniref:Uncharacterized protein n=1 Tax=Xiphophorus couchianus TaxID=32473 RepID=A0A3B5L129_9TELE
MESFVTSHNASDVSSYAGHTFGMLDVGTSTRAVAARLNIHYRTIGRLTKGSQLKGTELQVSSWWSKYLPTSYLWSRKPPQSSLRQRKGDVDGDFSDYGTPPPSPTPSQLTSPFRFFTDSWNLEIIPEHYEICFNFLRHLFDLFVVAFLWTVSPPAKLILEVFGVQGALRLWFHGMAMFFVSTAGMAGLLWLIQEYLPQFALIYGIIQALVISVSVRQSVILGVEEDKENSQEVKETGEKQDTQMTWHPKPSLTVET